MINSALQFARRLCVAASLGYCIVPSVFAVTDLVFDSDSEFINLQVDEDADNDGYINRAELQGEIDVSVSLGSAVSIGDVVTISNQYINTSVTIDSELIARGRVLAGFNTPFDGDLLTFRVTVNSAATDEVLAVQEADVRVDITSPEVPVITIESDGDDSGVLSADEYSEQLIVRVDLPVTVSVGDTVYVDYGRGNLSRSLTPLDLAEGAASFTLPVAAEGQTLSVVATIVDEAGNRSDRSSDAVLIDTTSPPPATVNSLLSSTSTPVVTGQYTADEDYSLSIQLNGKTYLISDSALSVSDDGLWQLTVPASDALSSGTYEVTAIVMDVAGNSSADETTDELLVDLIAPVVTVDGIAPSSEAAPTISGSTDGTDTGSLQVQTADGMPLCLAGTEQFQWSCQVKHQLSAGDNLLLAVVSDSAGNRTEQEFTVSVIFAVDSDNDGIPDDIEGDGDTDNDGIADYLDLDSDNDGITDAVEGMIDSDTDGIRDYRDIDSDNDGIADSTESVGAQLQVGEAVGTNGIADNLESIPDSGIVADPLNSDSDNREDFRDVDSDNDGITDSAEQSSSNQHVHVAFDVDGDGLPNYIDLDSDQDSIADIVEQQQTDRNADALLDDFVDHNVDGLHDALNLDDTPLDLDGDGLGNFIDLDSDDDGRWDLVEIGAEDVDDNGRHDSFQDSNTNGVNDAADATLTGGVDANQNGIDDRYDSRLNDEPDQDNDGIIDAVDADADGDGIADIILNDMNLLSLVYEYQPTAGSLLSTGTGTLGTGCVLLSASDRRATRKIDLSLLLLLLFSFCSLSRHRCSTLHREG